MIASKIKILLVEDNLADQVLIERQVKKIAPFAQIIHSRDLRETKSIIDVHEPDVILSDYQLSGFTGLDVLVLVNDLKVHIPFIFLTGTINDEEVAANSILTGATGYILKKNINSLHEKLLPLFQDIVSKKEEITLDQEHLETIDEMKSMIESFRLGNKVIRSNYLEMKKAVEKMKAKNK